MATMDSKVTSVDNNAIYHEVSPTITCALRLYNVIAMLMVLIAFTICLVRGHNHEAYYLLACNLVLSGVIGIVVNWWYRRGDLPADKYWYIFLLSSVIIFQAITADVYAYHVTPSGEGKTTHVTPHFTTPPHNGTVTWITINPSTVSPAPLPYIDSPFGN